MPSWKVLRWDKRPDTQGSVNLQCRHCETDADCPTGPHIGGLIIAVVGMGIIFDPADYRPPNNFLPDEIQCRKCRKIYSMEADHVR